MSVRSVRVKVKPNARVSTLTEVDGVWLAQVQAPPVDGKANAELIMLLARQFGVPKSAVSIRSGAGGRLKVVQIDEG